MSFDSGELLFYKLFFSFSFFLKLALLWTEDLGVGFIFSPLLLRSHKVTGKETLVINDSCSLEWLSFIVVPTSDNK